MNSYVIIPIFNYVNLNSSKYHHYNLFVKAVELKRDNKNLSDINKASKRNAKYVRKMNT